MTPPDFSVLLLAWDEADPRVAVLGGAALPPTLPLVYHLAAQQPVLAVYPHLPAPAEPPQAAAAETTVTPPASSPANARPAPAAPPTQPEPAEAAPPPAPVAGVRRLPPPTPSEENAAPVPAASFLVGLDDLAAADAPREPDALPRPAAAPAARPNQWPTGVHASQRLRGEVPAAPYLGASPAPVMVPVAAPVVVPVPTPRPSPTVREAAGLLRATAPAGPAAPPPGRTAPAALPPRMPRQAGDLFFDPDPELPLAFAYAAEIFAEPSEEVGAAEANALEAPEDDLTLDAPPAPAALPALPMAPPAAPEPAEPAGNLPATRVARLPALDGLNFRMIQYARQAAQLVRGRTDFGVIYAPNWPAWLAALEIRNHSGQPMVLYAAVLAAEFEARAERGWLLEVERMAFRRARLILVPSESQRARLYEHHDAAHIGEVRVVAAADEAAVQAVLSEVAAG